MSGSECAVVHFPLSGGGCDYLMEQMPPIETLGWHHIVAPFMARTSGYILRVVAAHDFTNVTVILSDTSHIKPNILMRGEYYQDDLNDVIMIIADKPVLVAQLSKSHETDNIGDGFMVVIPSTESYSNNISFAVASLSLDPEESYISVVTACENNATLSLDDNPLNYMDGIQSWFTLCHSSGP
ncbi:uncharacterized protein [Amphiura filiformis]|uniref:uncharacterized protein n=1 Tax=Amphiura filiformis TaxID=82378 RepID=UPI003B228635